MIVNKALTAAAVLLFTTPVVPALAHDDYGDHVEHWRLHRDLSEAHYVRCLRVCPSVQFVSGRRLAAGRPACPLLPARPWPLVTITLPQAQARCLRAHKAAWADRTSRPRCPTRQNPAGSHARTDRTDRRPPSCPQQSCRTHPARGSARGRLHRRSRGRPHAAAGRRARPAIRVNGRCARGSRSRRGPCRSW